MTNYYQQIIENINTFPSNETIKDKSSLEILGKITAYQACNLITRNIEDDNTDEYISFTLEAYKAKKDDDYIEISSNAQSFFKKLIKEKSFVRKLIIFPNKDHQKLLDEDFNINTETLPSYEDNKNFYYNGEERATDAIKKVFNALVLNIQEICFKDINKVVLKGTSNYNNQLSLTGYVVCCFYKPNFIKHAEFQPATLVDKELWTIEGMKKEYIFSPTANIQEIYSCLSKNDIYSTQQD